MSCLLTITPCPFHDEDLYDKEDVYDEKKYVGTGWEFLSKGESKDKLGEGKGKGEGAGKSNYQEKKKAVRWISGERSIR